jgi:hypothetical protein
LCRIFSDSRPGFLMEMNVRRFKTEATDCERTMLATTQYGLLVFSGLFEESISGQSRERREI